MAKIELFLSEQFGEAIQYLVDEFVVKHNIDSDDLNYVLEIFYSSNEGKEVLDWIKQLPKNFEVE